MDRMEESEEGRVIGEIGERLVNSTMDKVILHKNDLPLAQNKKYKHVQVEVVRSRLISSLINGRMAENLEKITRWIVSDGREKRRRYMRELTENERMQQVSHFTSLNEFMD